MKILIASKSKIKIEGISDSFRKFFPKEEIIVESVEAESEVSSQPINNDVFKGAKNRLENAKKSEIQYDYIVSCESGLLEQFGNWFNMQIVLIENDEGIQAWANSAGFQIPDKYIPQILETSLKEVFDNIFECNGGISLLSNGISSRKKLILDATIMALSKFNWPV